MFKKLLAFFAAMYVAVSFAAVDLNKASAAELDSVKGIGPAISSRIIDERKKGNFKDWNDFISRVKGIGEGNAAKFSVEGLTVGGTGFKGVTAPVPAATTAKKDDKPAAAAAPTTAAAKTEEKKPEAKPAAVAVPAPAAPASAAKDVKKDAKADEKAKVDEKKKMADEAKAKADADKAAKVDAKKAKEVKEAKPVAKDDVKADAAKPAASAAKK